MVLGARYKAEEVGYAIVGEDQKALPNEIGYNINEEITKDSSAVENANNQTTTGMANEIPGVNCPKLIADTSIAGGLLKFSTASATQLIGQSVTLVNTYTISPDGGVISINSSKPGWIYVSGGTYLISIRISNSNANASVSGDLREYKPGASTEFLLEISQSGGTSHAKAYTLIRTVPAGTNYRIYIKCGGSADYENQIDVTFVKLD